MAANGCRSFLKQAGIQVGLFIYRSFEGTVLSRTNAPINVKPLGGGGGRAKSGDLTVIIVP